MAQATDTRTELDQIDAVVEADGHVTSTPELTLPYMDDRYDDVREFYERSPAGGLEFTPLAVASPTYLYERMKEREGKEGFSFSEPLGPGPLHDHMEKHGVDVAVANNLGLVPLRNPRHSAGMINAYNNWMVDAFADYDDIYGNLLATPINPEATAEEIYEHADDDSVVGIQFLGTAIQPLPSDRKYDVVWEAATEVDLPVAIHTGTGPRAFPQQFHWSESYAEDHISAHPMQHISIITSLLFGGVMERYPDLEILMQEAGIEYLPYIKKRFDETYRQFGYDLPDLNQPPSEIIDERMYFSTQPLGHTAENPDHLAWMLEMAGVENVMWAADIPHPDFDTPEELFDRIKDHFSTGDLNRVMGGNAQEFYGI